MQDVGKMTNEELAKALDAFYAFVWVVGQSYLNDGGNVRFNQLRAEYAIRAQEPTTMSSLPGWKRVKES